jgi:hypothetical protein
MVEEHDNDDGQSGVDPSDMPYSAHEENIRAAFSTASAPAQAKVAPASLEKRDRNAFSNACDADPTEQANRPSKKRRTGAGDDTGSVSGEPIVLHLAVGAAAHKSKSQDKLDNLYVTLATKFHEELPAAGSEHASTVNRLLFDRSNLSASQSVHRVLQRQEISASLVGLANKDYEEVRARAHSWELPYRGRTSHSHSCRLKSKYWEKKKARMQNFQNCRMMIWLSIWYQPVKRKNGGKSGTSFMASTWKIANVNAA